MDSEVAKQLVMEALTAENKLDIVVEDISTNDTYKHIIMEATSESDNSGHMKETAPPQDTSIISGDTAVNDIDPTPPAQMLSTPTLPDSCQLIDDIGIELGDSIVAEDEELGYETEPESLKNVSTKSYPKRKRKSAHAPPKCKRKTKKLLPLLPDIPAVESVSVPGSTKKRGKTSPELKEISALKCELVSVSIAYNNLQETVIAQGKLIQDILQREDMQHPKQDVVLESKLEELEARVLSFYNNHDEQCCGRFKQWNDNVNMKIANIANTANTAIQTARSSVSKFVTTERAEEISKGVEVVEKDVVKLRDDIRGIQNTMNSLTDDNRPFSTVSAPSSPPAALKPFPITSQNTSNLPSSNISRNDGIHGKETSSAERTSHAEPLAAGKQNSGPPVPPVPKKNNDHLKKSIMFIDSNSNYLDPGMLWKNLTLVPCKTIQELRNKLGTTPLNDYSIIFIHTGVNDIDTIDGAEVAKDLIDIVCKIRHNHPSIKIIVSEITPRQIFRDDHVLKCNEALDSALSREDNVTLAVHSNLRNENWTFHKKDDDKHFSKVSISLFASNIKAAFRQCLGIPSRKYNNRDSTPRAGNRTGNRSQSLRSKRGYRNNHNSYVQGGDIDPFKRDLIKFLSSYKG